MNNTFREVILPMLLIAGVMMLIPLIVLVVTVVEIAERMPRP